MAFGSKKKRKERKKDRSGLLHEKNIVLWSHIRPRYLLRFIVKVWNFLRSWVELSGNNTGTSDSQHSGLSIVQHAGHGLTGFVYITCVYVSVCLIGYTVDIKCLHAPIKNDRSLWCHMHHYTRLCTRLRYLHLQNVFYFLNSVFLMDSGRRIILKW